MSRWALAASISIVIAGCMPFPRYAYLEAILVVATRGSPGFSDEEIRRAEVVAADVAKESGMKSGAEEAPGYLEPNRMKSASLSPPRRFLMAYTGTLRFGLPMELTLEVSDDGKILYFSLDDPNRGTPSPTFERIGARLKARVETAFPTYAIVHEPRTIGPIWSLPP